MKKKIIKKRGKKEEDFFKRQYTESWSYLKESRKFIYFSILIFFIFVLIGFLFPTPKFIVEKIIELFKEILSKTEGMSQMELIFFIFENNVQASLFGLVFGIFLGIYPVFALMFNGYLVGFVGKLAVVEKGFSSLFSLLPHGIFELPAIFISFSMGIKFGSFIFNKNKLDSLKDYFWNSLRVFIFVVVPLLIIAAIIEGSLIAILG